MSGNLKMLQTLINKFRIVLYFIVIGVWVYIWNRLRLGKRAEQELILKNYDIRKLEIENAIDNKSLSNLVDDTNKLYKGNGRGSGGDSSA